MTYSPKLRDLYLKISVSQYIIPCFTLIYACLVWSYSRKSGIDCIIKLLKSCNQIINFYDFIFHTDSLFSKLKLLKVKLLNELLFMLEDTHREKAPANETPALTKCTNAGIWAIGTSNQLFIKGS